MDTLKSPGVDAAVKDVAAYGAKLAAVFHQYALIAERVPSGFEGATNILDATVATLNQVLGLFQEEAESFKNGIKNELFSSEGALYVQHLVVECAKTLAKVEPILEDASLPRKEFKAKVKRDKRALTKKGVAEIVISELKLDEKAFLEKVESTKWTLATDPIESCMDRLYDLQLHLLLVYQVVTVGALSKDLSSGKVDIKSIVTYHDRIHRTANLVGVVEVPKISKSSSKKKRYNSSSESDYFSSGSGSGSDSDSDSDISSVAKPKKKIIRKCTGPPAPPPPPPPRPVVVIEPRYQPPLGPSSPPLKADDTPPKAPGFVWDTKPPSYSESPKPTMDGSFPSANGSTLLCTVTQGPNSTSSALPRIDEKPNPAITASYPEEKSSTKEEATKEPQTVQSTVHKPHLFNSKTNTFRFKITRMFRSKESLAAEMRGLLCNTDSHLLAFVIQRHDMRQVPHSAFHSLEATHMKTILSQLHNDAWYQTFSNLNPIEHAAIHRIAYPWADGKVHQREIVALKVVKEENKLTAWVALLKELLSKQPFTPISGGRILLAIVREKLVDGKPLIAPHLTNLPPPPPRAPFQIGPIIPAFRPPPLPCSPRIKRISDLRASSPPPTMPMSPETGRPPPSPSGGLPAPPGAFPPSRGPPPPLGLKPDPMLINNTPMTDYDAATAITTYTEYTVRLIEPHQPRELRPWSRVTITQESAERHVVQKRVERFQKNGGNVIEAKLRLTEDQSAQVTRLMDDLKFGERDCRFEWFWVEISIFNATGEITDFISTSPGNGALSATHMHLIARRSPKPAWKPLELYNALMRGPPTGPRPPVRMPQPPPPQSKPIVVRKPFVNDSSDSSSDSDSTSSDSSVGNVRRRLRRYKAKKNSQKSGKGRRFYDDSDSDSDLESDAEDSIKVKVQLKRGDDLVKKLLEMWTPQTEVKGKVKAVA